VIVISSLGGPGCAPSCPEGASLVASVDVEWSKNYRVRNGNRPFCYSVVYMAIPSRRRPIDLARQPFAYTSVYVEDDDETTELVRLADLDLRVALAGADRVAGHQLSSDLAVLAANAGLGPAGVLAAREAWRSRHDEPVPARHVIDTRYDSSHILQCRSRRLVDVCTSLDLDVSQPELRGVSMTALHREWLLNRDDVARERISVLNLRHSLSTALVALRAARQGTWDGTLNVNRLLLDQLEGAFEWFGSPAFARLV
jgi:hypothetical protein